MVLKGVDEIDWFTDRPEREAGTWKPEKLIRKWDDLFDSSQPNAQVTFTLEEKRELATFEMFKPSLNKRGIINFKIKGIGEVNQDLLTGISGSKFAEASLFIDDAYDGYAVCWYYTLRAYNKGDDLKWFQTGGTGIAQEPYYNDYTPNNYRREGTIYTVEEVKTQMYNKLGKDIIIEQELVKSDGETLSQAEAGIAAPNANFGSGAVPCFWMS